MKITRRRALHGLAATIAGMTTARFIGSDDVVAQAVAKAKTLNIRITDVKVFLVAPRSTFVKIYTNQQGLVGLGQTHMSGKEETVAAAILQLGEQLIGRDPTAIERNWEDLYEGVRWRGGPLTGAISAVDNASWDILGQALGQPIYKILGGPIHPRIKVYGGGGGITAESWAETKAQGYTTSRVGWPQGNVTQQIKYVHQMREAVGPDHELAIHGSGTMPTPDVVNFMRGVEDCNLLFVEEPLQMDDIGDWVHLRAHTTTPIATGERVLNLSGFTPYLQQHLIDFAQPDLHACGGLTEGRKIAAVAAANRIRIAPHGPQGPIGAFLNFHFDAATPNFYVQETRNYTNQADMDMCEGMVPQIKNGYCDLPDRPGLGTVLNEKVAAARGGPTYQVGNGLGLRTGRTPAETAAGRRGGGAGAAEGGAGGRGGAGRGGAAGGGRKGGGGE
jgi:L-alanine-DL-glutamate epimerase-like enolase superfamily enzyme